MYYYVISKNYSTDWAVLLLLYIYSYLLIPLWTASIWGSRLDLVVNIFPQCGHGSDSSFNPMWIVRTCLSRWPFLLKTFPHSVHLAGLNICRPRWTCSMWRFKVHFFDNNLQQCGQTTPSIFGWFVLTCSSMSSTMLLHMGQFLFLVSIISDVSEKKDLLLLLLNFNYSVSSN